MKKKMFTDHPFRNEVEEKPPLGPAGELAYCKKSLKICSTAEQKVKTLVRHVEHLERARPEKAQTVTDADALLPLYAREKETPAAECKFQDAVHENAGKERGRAEAMVKGVEMELGDVREQLEASRKAWTKAREERDDQERVWGCGNGEPCGTKRERWSVR
ncbi:hypothetical protein PsorP6_001441 [Peronosclerospora sorghi]|uniref:Uncharacterized protein n=1 Tax=Peronosclerospora sorghi TaxID=230839 RepID=A0ACC0WP79_9STRA|nr:hypothetical protein PsorP6_001441 [Peronosclerospora sorghi]